MRFPYDIDGLGDIPVRQGPQRTLTLNKASLAARTELSLQDSTAFFGLALELRDLVAELRDIHSSIIRQEGFHVAVGKPTPAEALDSLGAAMRSWATTMAALSIARETWAEDVSHHASSYIGEPREAVGETGDWKLGGVTEVEARNSAGPLAALIKPTRLRVLIEALESRFEDTFLPTEAALTSRGNTLAPLVAALPELAEQLSGPARSEDSDPSFLGQSLSVDLGAEQNADLSNRLARALELPLQLVRGIRDVREACGGIVELSQDKWEKGRIRASGKRLDKEVLKGLLPPDLERLEQIQADVDRADALYRGQLLLVRLEELKRAVAGLAVSDRYATRVESVLGLMNFDLGAVRALLLSKDDGVKDTARAALEAAGQTALKDPKLMEILGPDGEQNRSFGLLISHAPAGLLEDGDETEQD